MDDLTSFLNWCDVAEWRENERQKQEEQEQLKEVCEKFKKSGTTNREFFQVDWRNAIREQERRRKEEQQRVKEEEERKKKQEEEEEESQSLFEIHERMAETPQRKRQLENFAKKFRNYKSP